MQGVNKAIVAGHLGQDPDIRYTANGTAVANMSVATKSTWKGHDGQKQEKTEWHRLVAWGKLAELCQQYLRKGAPVYFEGRIETRKWQDQSGADRYSTEIIVSEMQFLSSGGDRQEKPRDQVPPQETTAGGGGGGADFDDIPFMPVDWRCG